MAVSGKVEHVPVCLSRNILIQVPRKMYIRIFIIILLLLPKEQNNLMVKKKKKITVCPILQERSP